ncbi:MAG: succinate dehydrogenase/fumarate reductase iron-sulfur subunit [Helicobacteraceae bacterium]|jgi:succinate dehydrogenase / fumarate reductase iron-sulfur subunit|nr:succinate dehydrogenase/fumarate reductase iron-sulfur subunit [Helicobacteraceae bacterium]
MEITFEIFRFNPEFDVLPSRSRFTLEISRGEVLLDALERIKADFDPTIAYRKSCRHGICGSCALKVNNEAVLACKANIFALADRYGEVLRLDPLDVKLCERDLIVNNDRFWEKYRAVSPWLDAPIDPAPKSEYHVPIAALERIDGSDACIACGACFYSCPVVKANERYLGPTALAKSWRFTADIRDLAEHQRLAAAGEIGGGAWDCVKCYVCRAVCPKDVAPVEKIAKLKQLSFTREAAADNVATRHAKFFKESVEICGRLDESASITASLGVMGALKHWREALAMLKRGKLKFSAKSIDDLASLRKLMKSSSRIES